MASSTRTLLGRSLIVAVAALFLAASQADARAGRGGGFGSRGARTWSAPPATTTAPTQAAPIQRSTQQPAAVAQRPLGQQARPGSFFSPRGGGFMGGLIGAGLIGMFLGYGLMGGLGGLGSLLGLLLQVALVVVLARFAFRFFQRRMQPAFAGAAPGGAGPLHREAAPQPAPAGGGAAYGSGGGRAPGRDALGITQADLNQFERLLGEVQAAYAAEDVGRLRTLATAEAASWLGDDLAQNAARGVVNWVADVKLLQGDVAESWREGPVEYATVAMRFAHRDWTVERDGGRVVEGDPERVVEATEVWTFRRERGGNWLLSAVQTA